MFVLSKTNIVLVSESGAQVPVKGTISYSLENTHPTIDAYVGFNGFPTTKIEPSINRNYGQNVGFLHDLILTVVFKDPTTGKEVKNGALIVHQNLPSFSENRIK